MNTLPIALFVENEPPVSASGCDSPDAVLASVTAALDSGDPAMIDDAYDMLRRAMRRLLQLPASAA